MANIENSLHRNEMEVIMKGIKINKNNSKVSFDNAIYNVKQALEITVRTTDGQSQFNVSDKLVQNDTILTINTYVSEAGEARDTTLA